MKKIILVAAAAALFSATTYATHAWSTYHWARTGNPFSLIVVNSTTEDWDPYVTQAVSHWSIPSVMLSDRSTISNPIRMTEENGSTSTKVRRGCKAPSGQIRICNLAYGQNGWLGIAGISIDAQGHIVSGYTKLNDTYFSWAYYNDAYWKQSVTCQEIGHNVGLDHQDEDFDNGSLFSCMDYQDPPYAYPNAHDYEQLATMYSHTDSYNSYDRAAPVDGGGDGGGCNAPPGKGCNKAGVGQSNSNKGWGASMGRHGQKETFIRIEPNGNRHITHVLWVEGH